MYMWFTDAVIITTLNATISNSSGKYFITQQNYDFNNGVINCDVNETCAVICTNDYSCRNTTIRCNDAANCNITCYGSSSDKIVCANMTIYTSSIQTSIACPWYSCEPLTIYTDYTNYPESNTELICWFYSCRSLQIRDAIDNSLSGYTIPNQFKIICWRHWYCSLSYPESYPLLSPNVDNSTGEYYYDFGSFVNISCKNSTLCSIDCSEGNCIKSTIDCANSEECIIKCSSSNHIDVCDFTNITAKDTNQFSFECHDIPAAGWGCSNNVFEIDNVNSVEILCSPDEDRNINSFYRCGLNTHSINNVDNLYIECNDRGACKSSVYNINNVTNTASVSCVQGCKDMIININNTDNLDILCEASAGIFRLTFERQACSGYINNRPFNGRFTYCAAFITAIGPLVSS